MPETGRLLIGMVAGFKSERWPVNDWNGGRLQSGIRSFQRNSVWGEETASQKIEHLGLMFGALAASPAGVVKGRGVPLGQLTFGLLIFPGIWDWYLQWREQRRGFYTKWEEDMLT